MIRKLRSGGRRRRGVRQPSAEGALEFGAREPVIAQGFDAQDNRQVAVLGVAMVSNESYHVRTTLEQIIEALRGHPVAELIDFQVEV